MSNIQIYNRINDPIDGIKKMGLMFSKSGMFGCDKPEQGEILAMICMVEGKSPVAITTSYDIVEGKLRKKALAALADFRSAGGKHTWLSSGDAATANADDRYAELELVDKEGKKISYRYSMADAKSEGLVKDRSRWVKRPGNMLRARCISNGLGMLCPEIFAGEDADESPEAEPKPLLPEKPTATVKAEPKPEPHIDVTATVVAQPEAKAEPKTETPVTEVKKYSEADIELSQETQRLTVNSMAALESVIGEPLMPKFILWLKKAGWIQDTLSELDVVRAKRIMRKSGEVVANLQKAGQ